MLIFVRGFDFKFTPLKTHSLKHILDNPIWNALVSGNKNMAKGNDYARFFPDDIAIFGGLKNNSASDLNNLQQQIAADKTVILFTPRKIEVPATWTIIAEKDLLQMVYEGDDLFSLDNDSLISLTDKDVPAMLELTSKTNPGPFFNRTIEFGNYEGIFDGGRLVAMAGWRLQPEPYIEISAVCTDPAYVKLGYATALIRSQIKSIKSTAHIPFLHVVPENTPAIKLYQKLGFRTRKQMFLYVLENGKK
jgi:ribosomal protein S18 acetylase RimI-like enzyme